MNRLILLVLALLTLRVNAEIPIISGSVVSEHLDSEVLRDNRIAINPHRSVSLYLPPGYADSHLSYPVIYFFHTFFGSDTQLFADGTVQHLFDRAIAEGAIKPFILVAADYSSTNAGGFYENSPVSGRWIDFTVEELVPFIDAHFRTLPNRESRGVAGNMIGGYAALKFAMLYPDRFSVVYALHPVGTGTGMAPMVNKPDWRKIHAAKSYADLQGDPYAEIFLSMSQAFLPNPDRPPFYCDFMAEEQGGAPSPSVENTRKLESRFLLDQLLAGNPAYAANLRQMRGIKFDWGRYDSNSDHVYANQAFTRKLDELGIEHEAEEYRGDSGNQNWTAHGRVHDDLLPFFARHLVFAPAD